jgi:hypothetical protein
MSVDFSVESTTFDHDPVWEAAPSMNLANGNAGSLLEVLGFPTDPWNLPEDFEFPTGHDMLGRVLLALGVAPKDEGMDWVPDAENPRWQGNLRRSGYTQDKLSEMHALAEYAIAHDRRITWG